MSAEHDPELTNDITGGDTKHPFSLYKTTKTTSLEAVKNVLQKWCHWQRYEITFIKTS